MLFLLAAGAAALLVWMLSWGMAPHDVGSVLIYVLLVLSVLLPFLYVASTRAYRARGVIRIAPERIEVPGARGETITLPTRGLSVSLTRVQSRLLMAGATMASVSRGQIVALAAEGKAPWRISTLALADPDQGDALVDDLGRVRLGKPPQGPRQHDPEPAARDAYDERLDRELEELE